MKTIEISITNKIATAPAGVFIVCGNSEYELKFTFDDEWQGHEKKTARFCFGGKYVDKHFEGDTCKGVVVVNSRELLVGVYADTDEELATTTGARIECRKGVLCDDIAGTQTDGVIVTKGEQGASAYEIAVKNGFEGSETEWLESLKGTVTVVTYTADEIEGGAT